MSPRWAAVFDRKLPDEMVDVAGWWRDRYAGRERWSLRDLRIVALRLAGYRVPQVAERAGVTPQTVRDRWSLVAPALVAQSGLDWAYAVPHSTAHRRALIRLGMEGPGRVAAPPPTPVPVDAVITAWRAGAPLDQIAAAAGMGKRLELIHALERAGVALMPERLRAADVGRRCALSRSLVTYLIRAGRFPDPDGWERGRRWWWEATIDAWATSRGRCPVCEAPIDNLPAHERVHD